MSSVQTTDITAGMDNSRRSAHSPGQIVGQVFGGSISLLKWVRVKQLEKKEHEVIAALNLHCSADASLERKSQLGRAIMVLTKSLQAKEDFYGPEFIEALKTSVYLARAEIHIGDSEVLKNIQEGIRRLNRIVKLIKAGKLDDKILEVYSDTTAWEKKMGRTFPEMISRSEESRWQALVTAPFCLEISSAWRSKNSRSESTEVLTTLLNDLKIEVDLSINRPLHDLAALSSLSILDDKLSILSGTVQKWAFSMNKAYSNLEVQGKEKLAQSASSDLNMREETCSLAEATLSDVEKILGTRKETYNSELFECQMLKFMCAFFDRRYKESYSLVVNSLPVQSCDEDIQKLAIRFERLISSLSLAFRQRYWNEGAEILYRTREFLARKGHGEFSLQRAHVLQDLGHFFRSASGYTEVFVHSRFKMGDPKRAINQADIQEAIIAFTKAEDIYKVLAKMGKTGAKDGVKDMRKEIDEISQNLYGYID